MNGASGPKAIPRRDEMDRSCRVRGEAHDVLVGIGVEEAQHALARRVHERRARARRRTLGVWVAEHRAAQRRRVLGHEPLGIQRAPGVVQVRVPAVVEPAELARAQLGEVYRRPRGARRDGSSPVSIRASLTPNSSVASPQRGCRVARAARASRASHARARGTPAEVPAQRRHVVRRVAVHTGSITSSIHASIPPLQHVARARVRAPRGSPTPARRARRRRSRARPSRLVRPGAASSSRAKSDGSADGMCCLSNADVAAQVEHAKSRAPSRIHAASWSASTVRVIVARRARRRRSARHDASGRAAADADDAGEDGQHERPWPPSTRRTTAMRVAHRSTSARRARHPLLDAAPRRRTPRARGDHDEDHRPGATPSAASSVTLPRAPLSYSRAIAGSASAVAEHAGEESADDASAVAAARSPPRRTTCPGTGRPAPSPRRTPTRRRSAAPTNVSGTYTRDEIDHAEPRQPEQPEHRRHDRREHHLEHGQVGEVELAHQLRRAARAPRARGTSRMRCRRRTRRRATAACRRPKSQRKRRDHVQLPRVTNATRYAARERRGDEQPAPTLSSAPPVSACPLVHPRASTAPTPISAPPATAAPSRCATRGVRAALDAQREPAGERRRSTIRRHHAEDLDDEPVAQQTAGVEVRREERVARRDVGRHALHRRRRRRGERAARAEPAPRDHERREQHEPEADAGEIRIGVRPLGAHARAHCALAFPSRGSSTGSSGGATTPGTSRRTAAPDARSPARRTAPPSPAARCDSTRRRCRRRPTPALREQRASARPACAGAACRRSTSVNGRLFAPSMCPLRGPPASTPS